MEIRYRPRLSQLPWWSGIPPLLQLVLARDEEARLAFWQFWAVFLVVVLPVTCVLLSRMGVDLTPEALVVRGYRRHVVPWPDILSMHARTTFGTRTVRVVTAGKTWTLRAPIHTRFLGPDPEFQAKADTIWRYWQERTATAPVAR